MDIQALDPQELTTRITQLARQSRLPQTLNEPQAPPHSSPISTVPPEILIEIFKFALPAERFPSPSPTAAPLSLIHVCRYWRDMARAVPDLWSALHLTYTSAEDAAPTRLWLSLSGDKPLSLSLSLDFDEKAHQPIIDILVDHSKRWHHVRFEFQNLQCPRMYDLARAMDRVPLLSSFEFCARSISSFNIEPISQLLSTAPNLKDLTWVDDLADADTLHSLPLPRLSRLSLAMNYGTLDYLKLLNLCSNLEHVRISRPFPDIQPLQSPLLLAKLTSLNIAHDLTGILDNLILPSLKHLRIHMDAGVPEHGRLLRTISGMQTVDQKTWDPTSLLKLVERSSCAIASLDICMPMKVGDFNQCLGALSGSLQSLTLSGWSTFNDTIAQALTPDPRMDPNSSGSEATGDPAYDFCPNLLELNIDSTVYDWWTLVDMVQKRLDLPQPLTASQPAHCSTNPELHRPPVHPLERLRVRYIAGHQDIPHLRELSSQANSRRKGSFKLTIVESRMNSVRGNSAGRTRPLLHRRKGFVSR